MRAPKDQIYVIVAFCCRLIMYNLGKSILKFTSPNQISIQKLAFKPFPTLKGTFALKAVHILLIVFHRKHTKMSFTSSIIKLLYKPYFSAMNLLHNAISSQLIL